MVAADVDVTVCLEAKQSLREFFLVGLREFSVRPSLICARTSFSCNSVISQTTRNIRACILFYRRWFLNLNSPNTPIINHSTSLTELNKMRQNNNHRRQMAQKWKWQKISSLWCCVIAVVAAVCSTLRLSLAFTTVKNPNPITCHATTRQLPTCGKTRFGRSKSLSSSSSSSSDRRIPTWLYSSIGGGSSGSLFQDQYFDSLQPQESRESDNRNTIVQFESLIEAATLSSAGTLLGGDFAGLAATFHPGTGEFIPLPEHLIPPSLIEWGQEPKCLELLVSEDLIEHDYGDDDDDDEATMKRVTTTVLPDTGCAVDNLETIKAVDEIDLIAQWSSRNVMKQNQQQEEEDSSEDEDDNDWDERRYWDENAVVALKYPLIGKTNNNNNDDDNNNENELRLETIFGLDDGTTTTARHRLRVVIDLQIQIGGSNNENENEDDDNDGSIIIGVQKPMMIIMERRTSSISSGGTISDGGGLDGRTVSLLLGDRLRGSQSFVDTQPPLGNSYENGPIRYVALPANILLAYGWITNEQWVIQVGHVVTSQDDNGDGTTIRRVISRTFTENDVGDLDFEIDSWIEHLDTTATTNRPTATRTSTTNRQAA
jgi:hypothetical protein